MATRANRLSSLPTLIKAQSPRDDDYVVLLHLDNRYDHSLSTCTYLKIDSKRSNTPSLLAKPNILIIDIAVILSFSFAIA